MVDALNGLFGRIGALMESERRFTADAAHELRTPIAAIRAQAQVALAEPDDALRRHALQATLQGCDRATRLVEQLLTLSRLESADAPALAVLDLSALVRGVVGELAPKALDKQQRIELDAAPDCRVQGEATLLAVLVRNLVDNAIRYSPTGARVQVAVAQRGRHGAPHGGRQRARPGRSRPAAPGRALLPRGRQRTGRQRPGLVDRAPHRRGASRATERPPFGAARRPGRRGGLAAAPPDSSSCAPLAAGPRAQ